MTIFDAAPVLLQAMTDKSRVASLFGLRQSGAMARHR
jgi:hypothetical protein